MNLSAKNVRFGLVVWVTFVPLVILTKARSLNLKNVFGSKNQKEKSDMNELQIAKEVFLSIVKWFLIVLLANNLIWGLVLYSFVSDSSADISQSQNGTNNYQEMTNG